MTTEERAKHVLLFVAMCKQLSEHSTFLTNELKQKPKHEFKVLVNNCESFVAQIEKGLTKECKADLERLTDTLHECMNTIRKEIVI